MLSGSKHIILLRTILAFAVASINAVWSIYMDHLGLSNAFIGFLNALLVVITVLLALTLTPFLEKFHEKKIVTYALWTLLISSIGFAFTNSVIFFIFFAILFSISESIRSTAFTILLRDNSTKKNFTKEIGLQGSLVSLGWFLGPLIGGYFLAVFNFKGVFIYTSLMICLVLFFYLRDDKIKEKVHSKKIHTNIVVNISLFLKSKKLYSPFLMEVGINFWWALIFIYVPLLIIKSDLGIGMVGLFLALTQLPLALFEKYAGEKVQKYGFKIFFLLGFTLLGIAAFASYFIVNIYAIIFLLVVASIAMSFIEAQPTAYLFSKLKPSEVETLSPPFALASQVGSFLGKIILASFLLFFSQNIVFLITGITMFIFALIALFIRE
jgi:MFS family permease